MPRLIHIVLVLVLGAPSLAWGGNVPGNGIDLVSTTCCCLGDQAGDESNEAELSRACCCKPLPATPGTQNLQTILTQSGSDDVPQPLVVGAIEAPVLKEQISTVNSRSARGPPPRTSLYSLRIALLV